MRAILKILILLVLVVISGAAAVIYENQTSSQFAGNYNVLLLCVDPSENTGTDGMGAADMAFAVKVEDSKVTNVTAIYPGGKRSQTYTEPESLGSGMLLLHDSLFGVNTTFGAERAQEIVEYNTGIKTDAVVMITPDAVDALLAAIGPIEVNGTQINVSDSIGFIRDNTETANSTETRGAATESLMQPIIDTAKNNPASYINLVKVAIEQYNQGNIRVIPADLVTHFAISSGIKSLVG